MYVVLSQDLSRVVVKDAGGLSGYYFFSGSFSCLNKSTIVKPHIYKKKPSRFLCWLKFGSVVVVTTDVLEELLGLYGLEVDYD